MAEINTGTVLSGDGVQYSCRTDTGTVLSGGGGGEESSTPVEQIQVLSCRG